LDAYNCSGDDGKNKNTPDIGHLKPELLFKYLQTNDKALALE